MHTTSITYTNDRYDPEPGKVEEFICHHNGDFSGDIKLSVEPHRVEEGMVFEGLPEYLIVNVPFEVLKELVANYLRSQLISNYENMDANAILGRVLL